MTSSVDGLISGMSTSQVISQLMQIESAGQTRLKQKVTTQQKTTSAYQSINTKIAALKTATAAMLDSTNWQPVKATSSSSTVAATAATGATVGQFTFNVTGLAKNEIQTAIFDSASNPITMGAGLDISFGGGAPTHVAVTTDTPQGVADAINGANLGVKAAVITSNDGKTVLQLTATKSGGDNAFTIDGLKIGGVAGRPTQIQAGTDAEITVGTVGSGGYVVTSDTNTFSSILPNVSVTVTKLENGVTVAVSENVDAIAAKMQAMVDATNAVLTDIATQSVVGGEDSSGNTKTAGPLAGNFLVRTIDMNLVSSVANGLAGYGDFKQLGLQLDKTGAKLTFDKAAFVAAYQADPTATKNAITAVGATENDPNGLAKTLDSLAAKATTDITSAIQSGTDQVRQLNKQIDDWDVRLQLRQESLQKQFSAMEVALGKLKDQANWLTGQIASLGSYSSSSSS